MAEIDDLRLISCLRLALTSPSDLTVAVQVFVRSRCSSCSAPQYWWCRQIPNHPNAMETTTLLSLS